MREEKASQTALGAAIHRANHQRIECGLIFSDPLAVRIVEGAGEYGALLEEDGAENRGLRLFIAARSRFAEDKYATAMRDRGVRQLVVLGAGLDTFAYRQSPDSALRLFEVDHPATQAWKLARLGAAGIAIPSNLTFVSVDFETQCLRHRLEASGFNPGRPSFFMILGVIAYLSQGAIDELLATLGGYAACEFAWDYSIPPEMLDAEQRKFHDALIERTTAAGELYQSLFTPDRMAGMLYQTGFAPTEDLDVYDLLARYLGEEVIAASRAAGRGSAHMIHAMRVSQR